MLKERLDVYVPMVDDDGIDAIIRRTDGSIVEVQIKARSRDVQVGNSALFAGIPHEQRENYFFIFYSERLKKTWIMTSEEFIKESRVNKSGIHAGKRTIKLNGHSKKKGIEYGLDRFEKYVLQDFSRLT